MQTATFKQTPENRMRYRQIHLDFHTSEAISGLGKDFSEQQFIDCLKTAHVDTINLFAQCHHGYAFFDSKVIEPHPGLVEKNLLDRMLAACAKNNIRTVIYLTVGWNEKAGRENPEWVIRKKDGSLDYPEMKHPHSSREWGWYSMCLNSPYLDQITSFMKEIAERYKPTGLWLDIADESRCECYCNRCQASMRENNLNIENEEDVKTQAKLTFKNYLKKTSEALWSILPEATLNHNGDDRKGRHELYPYWSHIEIESLPTGGWGYDHFPTNARYFTQLEGKDVIGMTGKFQKHWGEMGGYKSQTALNYEVAQIMSLCCRVCIGDQLHPHGLMDSEVYQMIGQAYTHLEKCEPWLYEAKLIAEIAILSPDAVSKELGGDNMTADTSETGASQVLMEAHIPHLIVDEGADFSRFKLMIIPDKIRLDKKLKEKLQNYINAGGKLLLSAESGLEKDKNDFALDTGLEYLGKSPFDVEYFKVESEDMLKRNVIQSTFINYTPGHKTKVKDAEVLVDIHKPFFNRTYARFSGHGKVAAEGSAGYPAVVKHQNIVYFSAPIFSVYRENGMSLHKNLILNAIDLLIGNTEKRVDCKLPSAARLNICRQEKENRDMLHFLFATPSLRGDTEVVEDVIPLYDKQVTYYSRKKVKAVYTVPEQKALAFKQDNEALSFVVPEIRLSQIVCVDYQD